jgi:hypothetical protein
MQRTFRMISAAVLVLGFMTIVGTTANAGGVKCCSGANCCTPSAGQCCGADSTSCWTYACKPPI